VTDSVRMCSICELSVRRCLGHRGLRAHIAEDRLVSVEPERYEAAEKAHSLNYDKWARRERDYATKRGGKGKP
jgi:hypothetical protein